MTLDKLLGRYYIVARADARFREHEYVTPEHFLYSILMHPEGQQVMRESGGQFEFMIFDLDDYYKDYVPTKTPPMPLETVSFHQMMEMAAMHAQMQGKTLISLPDVLFAMFELNESFARYILLKNGVERDEAVACAKRIVSELSDSAESIDDGENAPYAHGNGQPSPKDKKTMLETYTTDLVKLAAKGKLDPLVGREDVLERTIQVLCRRLKNNPVHVGDPGVGKTAIAEGLAQRVTAGDVPKALQDVRIFRIDMGALVAGTRYRGDFEERMVQLLDAISEEPNPIVYIDEIHTVVGAGAVSGGGTDAAGIMKPYLSRGDIRFIGSTTHEEYKKHIEKDRALARRFAKIDIHEPTQEECVAILKGVRPHYEDFHGVKYPDDVLEQIVTLSAKHMNDRFLPDKAIDVMDEAGVVAALASPRSQRTDASPVESAALKEIFEELFEDLELEDLLMDENIAGFYEYMGWSGEALEDADIPRVSTDMIEKTVANMAKVPAASVTVNEKTSLAHLAQQLSARVFGQARAIEAVTHAIHSARAGLNEPGRPVASLLFVGPTGVGKTEVAKQLADILGVQLTRFDMSEYQEKHAVSRLIGSPPGYVGYEEGGLLTEAIRRTPHCVLLLDEIEKAHPDILNVLLQVMDYGTLTDNAGKQADFGNVVLIMTSNAGAREMSRQTIGFDSARNFAAIEKAVEKTFSPEFRNRLDAVVEFNPVDSDMALQIAQKALDRLGQKLAAKGITFKVAKRAVEHIAAAGLSEAYGAREIIRMVENDVKKLLVQRVLFDDLADGGVCKLTFAGGKLQVK